MPTTALAAPTPRRHPLRRGARGGASRRSEGSLSLEAAMALPLVALCALGLLQVVGVARDALLASDLARLGARVAATDPSDAAVVAAVTAAAGHGVTTEVTVSPSPRHHGDPVVVIVHVHRPDRWVDLDLRGRAVAHGEPVLDTGGGP